MTSLATFNGGDLSALGDRIRAIGREARSMEDSARRVVDVLYDELGDGAGGHATVLVRLYKTHPLRGLPPDLRAYALETLDEVTDDSVRCLTLLATRGEEEAWNDRTRSHGHKAIPLPSAEFVARLPMVAALVDQLGLSVEDVLRPRPERAVEMSQRTYEVFHVPEARGSEHIPAQDDFVVPYAVRSALGFGGMLFTGDFFAVVLFSRVPIDAAVADTIRILSLAVRVALMPFVTRVFD
jgi:xanthine/CO dehydrogenase XdhC/CoxF family maturation factor